MKAQNFKYVFQFFFLNSDFVTAESLIIKEFINSSMMSEKIEYYWSKPSGTGPFPVLLMIHPEQESPKTGGAAFVKFGH